MSEMDTLAPWEMRSFAVARPMPDAPPLMAMTLPENGLMLSPSGLWEMNELILEKMSVTARDLSTKGTFYFTSLKLSISVVLFRHQQEWNQ